MLKPPIHWYGGKQKMVDQLLPYIPEHDCYVEAYGGAGALLFGKQPSRVEIYNDRHNGVVNLYRIIRDNTQEFRRTLSLTPYCRKSLEYAWWFLADRNKKSMAENDDLDTLVEMARCFFIIARQSFSARIDAKPGWSSSKQVNKAVGWFNAIDGLDEIHERLKNVQIDCRPAYDVIKQYDGVSTFMYLDPPYIAETRKEPDAYSYEMTDTEHLDLIALIKRSKSMILLSGYHNEMYDDLLGAWHYRDFAVNASAINTNSSDADKKRIEVVWWNNALEINRIGAQQFLQLEV